MISLYSTFTVSALKIMRDTQKLNTNSFGLIVLVTLPVLDKSDRFHVNNEGFKQTVNTCLSI